MTFELRPYQAEAVEYAIEATGKPILCAPTGSGKTIVCGFIAKHYLEQGKKVAFLTPREEILWQNHGAVQDICGEGNVAVLKAGEEWQSWLPMHIVSWPTLIARTGRKVGGDAWWPDVDVVLIDECHLAVSPRMVERILPHYDGQAKIIGVTATPARNGGNGLGYFFDEIKHVTTVPKLIDEGFLSPCEYWGGKMVDVEGVKTTGGDFNNKALAGRVMPLIGDVVENWLRLAADRHTLVFAVDVAHAEALAERFREAGVSAASLHIHMTPERRRKTVKRFKQGVIQVLVNVTIASYGFDAPSLNCVVLARPTKSIVLHLQMLGRGMRIDPNNPDKVCKVIDHANNVRRLGAAEDLYRWRLDGKKRAAGNWTRHKANPNKSESKERECEECSFIFRGALACPKCGWDVPLPKRDVEAVDAKLVRISGRREKMNMENWPDEQTVYRMLRGWQTRKGYKPGWVGVKYKEIYGCWPPWGYERLLQLEPAPVVRNYITRSAKAYAKRQKQEGRAANAAG